MPGEFYNVAKTATTVSGIAHMNKPYAMLYRHCDDANELTGIAVPPTGLCSALSPCQMSTSVCSC